jgi:hypothetical protein
MLAILRHLGLYSSPVRRVLITLAALVASGGLLWLAMALGSVGFETRKGLLHEGRLARLLEKQPHIDLVTQALEEEGTRLVGTASGPEAIRALALAHAGRAAPEVQRRAGDWPNARAFRAGDVVYFIFSDASGVMRAYAWARYP